MSENNQMMSVEGQLVGMPLAGPESFSQQQLEYLKRALGVDETVLWEGTMFRGQTTTANLSEAASNFEYVRVFGYVNEAEERLVVDHIQNHGENYVAKHCGNVWYTDKVTFGTGETTLVFNTATNYWVNGASVSSGTAGIVITKIVGCNRIAGGNQ